MKLAKFVKHGLCIFTSIAVMGTLAGCGGQAGSMNKGKLVKIAVCVSSQTPASMAMREVFKPRLEELTDGKYDIQIYDSGVLGSEKSPTTIPEAESSRCAWWGRQCGLKPL